MSELNVGTLNATTQVASNLKHASASTNNITLHSNGNVTTAAEINAGGAIDSATDIRTPKVTLDTGSIANNYITHADGTITSTAPRVIYVSDSRSGCPATLAADTDIVAGTFTLVRPASVVFMYDTIGTKNGRFDTYLVVDGTERRRTLTSENNSSWKPVHIIYGVELAAGSHSWSTRCNTANVIGCGSTWGSMTIFIHEH